MTLPQHIPVRPDNPLEPDLDPEQRFEWVLQRLPKDAWSSFETQYAMDNLEAEGTTGLPDVDDFFERYKGGKLVPPKGVVK